MSERTAATLQTKFFDDGNRLAREAETGSMQRVNQELAQFRETLSALEYNALIKSIQSSNTARVAQDQYDLAGGQVSRLTVPTLILEDSKTDRDKLPDHIGGRILSDKKQAAQEPKPATPAAKAFRDGDYPLPWSEAMADKAFRDVLYPGKK
jgi:hypothetical protein